MLPDLPVAFASERLSLRPYRPGDAAAYAAMLRDNHAHLWEFMPEEMLRVQTEADALAWFASHAPLWDARELFIFGAWERASGEYVGECYLANPDWHVPRIEVGYFLVHHRTGQGFATEAARAAVRFAFDHMQVARVDLRCLADNAASQQVALRCGFVPEGRMRQNHRKKDGSLVDTLWFGLLREEWQRLDGGASRLDPQIPQPG